VNWVTETVNFCLWICRHCCRANRGTGEFCQRTGSGLESYSE